MRMQKELTGQPKSRRRANVQHLLSALHLSHGGATGSEWSEQLQALLLVLLEDTSEVETSEGPDLDWLELWFTELADFVPGMCGQRVPIMVDSQPRSMSSGEGTGPQDAGAQDREIDELLCDEAEEQDLRRREEEAEQQRQADHERLTALERDNLKREAEDYKAWEDLQIQRYMEAQVTSSKRRCVMQIETSSGSGDKPVMKHVFEVDVPENGTTSSIVIKARMELDPDGVETQLVPSPPGADGSPAPSRARASLEEEPSIVNGVELPCHLPARGRWHADRPLVEPGLWGVRTDL